MLHKIDQVERGPIDFELVRRPITIQHAEVEPTKIKQEKTWHPTPRRPIET